METLHFNPYLLSVPAYVGGKPIEEVQAEFQLSQVVKLASNENPLGPSPRALAAFCSALDDAHRYPGSADKQLRQKLAEYYNARHAATFTVQNFVTGNGLSDLLRMIAHAFLFGGGEALYCIPTFPLYSIFAKMFGATPVGVPHRNFRYDLSVIAESITANTRVIFICNPNNPTGTIVTRDEVARFMVGVPSSVVVVFDESYFDFVPDAEYTNSIEYVKAGNDNVIVLRGFSKSYGLANLRIGYALMSRGTADYVSRAQIPFNTGDGVLRAAAAALGDDAYLQVARELVTREREFLYAALSELDLDFVPSQANFILLINLPCDVKALDDAMLRRGVIVRPMGGFGMPDAIRVSIGTHEENEKMLHALGQTLKEKL